MCCNEKNDLLQMFIKNTIYEIGVREPELIVQTVCITYIYIYIYLY